MMTTVDSVYKRPSLDDIRQELDAAAKTEYGDDADVSDAAVIGQQNGVLSVFGDSIAQSIQSLRWAVHLLSATGQDLDTFGADDGVTRKQATNSTVYLQIDATVGTQIPEQTQYATEDGILFETLADVVIGEPFVTTAEDGKQTPLLNDAGDPVGRVSVEAVSVETGLENNVGANTITVEAEPLEGVWQVTNLQPAMGGADEESDPEYQDRIYQGRIHPKNNSEDGIKTKLESTVTGIQKVKVVPNRTMTTDAMGNPPKSTHIYVIGGDDQEVANAILDAVPAPANTVGSITKTVYNLSGDERQISFDRATPLPIYAKVTIGAGATFDVDNGANNIKEQMKKYVDLLSMGDNVLFSKFFEYVWTVPGLTAVKVEIGTSKDALSMADVDVDEFQLATLDAKNVEVINND